MNHREKSIFRILVIPVSLISLAVTAFTFIILAPQEDLKAKYDYNDFESTQDCKICHPGFYEQWAQSMMSQAYTHHWDEIEYFDLAVAHAKSRISVCNNGRKIC